MYNILIIEEDKDTAYLIKEILEEMISARFILARGRAEAMETLQTYHLDIITLSLTAPNGEGYILLQQILEDPENEDIPIIVSAKARDMEGIKEALKMGATNYFIKSINREYMGMILNMVMMNTLEHYEQRKEFKTLQKNLSHEFKIAGLLQKSMQSLYSNRQTSEVEMKAYFKPAHNISSALFDFKKIQDKSWFFVVDAKGNTMIQLMISILLKAIFNEGINQLQMPGQMMTEMNKRLYQLSSEMEVPLVSCILGKIENKTLTYSNAGFPNPFFLTPTGEDSRKFSSNWHMLGFDEETYYIDYEHPLKEGDCLLMHTEGLYRNKSDELFKPEEAFHRVNQNYEKDCSLDQVMDHILREFIDEELEEKEDFSVVLLRIK